MTRFGLFIAAGCWAWTSAAGQDLPLFPAEQPQIRILPAFHIRTVPASEEISDLASSAMLHRSAGGAIVARRIVTDAADQIYFAYELAIEPGEQPDELIASFRPLDPANSGLDAAHWTMRRPPAFPPQRMIRLGESIAIPLGAATNSGATLIDEVTIGRTPLGVAQGALYMRDRLVLLRSYGLLTVELRKRGIEPPLPAKQGSSPPPAPTISGAPRQFGAADAGFKATLFLRLSVNGGSEIDLPSARGRLIWFSLPGRGRYILSLVPRPELGFARAGEARGGYLNLQMDGDSFVLTSGTSIAPAGAAYFIYALHDPEWEPVASSQRGKPQAGSVGLEELASFRKDQVK